MQMISMGLEKVLNSVGEDKPTYRSEIEKILHNCRQLLPKLCKVNEHTDYTCNM